MRPTDILLSAIQKVLGPNSDVARNLLKAVETDSTLDMMLAHTSFDDLQPAVRRKIADEVERVVAGVLAEREGTLTSH
ncbi:MAG: hypothetical protein FJX35_09310 [Alphaproteobacteria bacterium]|nr:hypothetical protein [Alphaproteobacteria bacterium]